jgi:hypothetical protein
MKMSRNRWIPPLSPSEFAGVDENTGADSPDVVLFQPRPIDTRVTHYDTLDETVTTINREWKPGDSGPDGRCRRCLTCVARNNKCQMSIGADIPRAQAWDWSPRAIGATFEAR